ncbi:MAG: LuxR C-terminal-related transcriptional regulator [Acidimicrobiales bacterium]
MLVPAQGVQKRFVAGVRFLVPDMPQGFVPRPELVDRLESTAASLTLVVGSPGSGKTALLGSWVAQRTAPTVWLTCDPTDADPVRFWSALAVAIRQVVPDAGTDTLDRLDQAGRESPDAAASLASDCAGTAGLAIVVDDAHEAGPAPAVMAAFVRSLPPGVRLVLATRRDPAFPIGRLRVQGRLLEVRDEHLRFRFGEARQFFDNLDVNVTDTGVEHLCELTEGWVAGLQLAALYLAGRPDADTLVQAFAETDRGLVDFLVNEVLDLQPPDVEDFLMDTSVLDTFDGSLCDAVTGRDGGTELLRRLHAAHLFVIEVGRQAGWYRYHNLFARFLQARLRTRSRGRLRRAHTAASRAYAQRGDLMSAVNQSMAADDVDAAFQLLRQLAATEVDAEGRQAAIDTLRAWLRQHGNHYVSHEPGLVLECLIVLESLAASEEVEVWLHRVEHGGPQVLEPPTAALLAAVWGLHRLHQGDPAAALERGHEVTRILGHEVIDDDWMSQWPTVVCQAHLWLDEPTAARQAAQDARLAARPSPAYDTVRLPGLASWAAAVEGELPDSEHQAHTALEAADALGLLASNFGRVHPHLGLAAVARERRELDDAERLLALASESAVAAKRPPTMLLCELERSRLAATRGATDEALQILEGARRIMPSSTPVVTDHIDRLHARIAVDAGHPGAAELVDKLLPTTFRQHLRTRLALTSNGGVVPGTLDGASQTTPTRRLRVERELLAARVVAPTDRQRALQHLEAALRLGEPAGLVSTVVDEGHEIHELLEALPTDAVLDGYVERLLDAARIRPAPPRGQGAQPLVDRLSDRELTTLHYLASRLTYREIANELYVSVNTVKSHIKAVYRKLGASSRTEAVKAARQIGVL